MEFYKKTIEIVDTNIIYCLIPIILTLIFTELFFKNRFETKRTLNLIRWIIIAYSIITWTITIIEIADNPQESAFINRAVGPYALVYWVMLLLALIFPFTLFSKKLGTKFWYVLFVAFFMKIGIYFERFVIITTSYHRDYITEIDNAEFMNSPYFGIGMIFLKGIIITILTLVIFEIKKTVHNKELRQKTSK